MKTTAAPARGPLVRDLLTFSFKLWLDGFKDFVLMPLAWLGACVDFFFGTRHFYRVLRFGENFDHRLDLFGALQEAEQDRSDSFGAGRAGSSRIKGQRTKESVDV